MSLEVYLITYFSEGSNAYGVARDDRADVSLVDQKFDTEEEAKEYIREMSREICPELSNKVWTWNASSEEHKTTTSLE
jgi:hypothetical protein